ncbi:lysophospholipase L1-like esterase [Brevundimonas sp. UYEF29]|uniref:SGNH/GDSL hydrolase family protein n=1 Tax=Brevundimonas sp. UYEF29 TaxID=3156346 RepID=UPI003390F03A
MPTTFEALQSAVDAAFRDHAVRGVPASGPHEPIKHEIRTALAMILVALDDGGFSAPANWASDLAELVGKTENIDAVASGLATVAQAVTSSEAAAAIASDSLASALEIYGSISAVQQARDDATGALAEILNIAAEAPEAPSVVNKVNRDGSNVEAEAFREAISAVSVALLEDKLRRGAWAKALQKLRAGAVQLQVACQGDSLTYGQNDGGTTGPRDPINGSTSRRSADDWPGMLGLATYLTWGNVGGVPAVSVANLGFPGDTVLASWDRWKDDSREFDVRFLMLGTNDSGSMSVDAFVAGYRVIIEAALARGEAVALISPPNGAGIGNQDYRVFATAVRDLASEYDLPWADAEEILRQFRGVPVTTTDGIHLTADAYAQLGWTLATMLMPWGSSNCLRVGPGTRIDGTDFASPSGNYDAQATSRSGRVTNIAPGKAYALAVYCTEDVVPVIEMWNNSTSASSLVKYVGGRQVGVAYGAGTAQQPLGTHRNAQTLPVLRKGLQLILLHNQSAGYVQIDSVRFEPVGSSFDTHNWRSVRDMAGTGVLKPGVTEGWSYRRSNERFEKIRFLQGRFRLGSPASQGISLFATNDTLRDFGDNNQLTLLRVGTALTFWHLVDGNFIGGGPIVVDDDCFSAATEDVDLAIGLNGSTATAYVNGAQVGSPITYTGRAGYPAWLVAVQDLTFECKSMSVLETY